VIKEIESVIKFNEKPPFGGRNITKIIWMIKNEKIDYGFSNDTGPLNIPIFHRK
jgi:hypothetical protein